MLNEINGLVNYLRSNRVPRKAAAVFAAGTHREMRTLVEVCDGRRRIPGAEYFEKHHPRQYREVQDSLRIVGLSASQIAYVLKGIAYEIATRDLVPDVIDYIQDEAIRDGLVARGVIDETQYREGIEEKFGAN